MPDNQVNSQVLDTIKALQQATMSQPVVRTSGAGKAYQSVAQSTAISVQDAADMLRNMSTISSTAIGVAMSQMIANPSKASEYTEIITQANNIVNNAATNFKTIGDYAAQVLNNFPST